jgi:GT2 family glycosyltransferase
MASTRVAALMAAHNRRDLTLACLRSLNAQRVPGVTVDVFVLDDGSSDGTSEAIGEQFPEVTVLHGDGELFWSGGMRQAFAAAIAGDYDHYLWLNDDVYLDDSALAVLLDTARPGTRRPANSPMGAWSIPTAGDLCGPSWWSRATRRARATR